MKCSLISLIFLKRSVVFPILLFSSISLHWSLRKVFLSLFLFFGTLHKNEYIFPFLLCLLFLYSQLLVRPPQTIILAFFHFFFLGTVLIPAPYTMSWTSARSSSGTLSYLIPWIYLSLPLYNSMGFLLRSYWNGLVVFLTFFNLNLYLLMKSSWSEPQSAPGLVFADCMELLHHWLQRIQSICFRYSPFGDAHV